MNLPIWLWFGSNSIGRQIFYAILTAAVGAAVAYLPHLIEAEIQSISGYCRIVFEWSKQRSDRSGNSVFDVQLSSVGSIPKALNFGVLSTEPILKQIQLVHADKS